MKFASAILFAVAAAAPANPANAQATAHEQKSEIEIDKEITNIREF